jgi:hypothetical protein
MDFTIPQLRQISDFGTSEPWVARIHLTFLDLLKVCAAGTSRRSKKAVGIGNCSGQMYLDQSTSAPYGFSAYIPAGTSFGPSVLSQYSGQSIDVTGSIINYNGEPEIEVTSASQITLAQ